MRLPYLFLASSVCITACSTEIDTSIVAPNDANPSPISARDANGQAVYVSDNIAAEKEVHADYGVELENSLVDTTTKLSQAKLSDAKVSIRQTAAAEYALTVDGKVFSFKSTDIKASEENFVDSEGNVQKVKVNHYEGTNGTTKIRFGASTLYKTTDLPQSKHHSDVVFYSIVSPEDGNYYGYSVIGARTPERFLPTGSARYLGRFTFETRPEEDDTPLDSYDYYGNATLSASLQDKKISGTLTNVQGKRDDVTLTLDPKDPSLDDGKVNNLSGQIEMTETAITNGHFSGDLLAVGDMRTSLNLESSDDKVKIGSYAGGFYGPSAEEVTGVMKVQLEKKQDKDEYGVGSFRTFKQ